jgi:hypothetical protein
MSDEMRAFSAGAPREIRLPQVGDSELGPLKLLPGTWANVLPKERIEPDNLWVGRGSLKGKGKSQFDGCGWNLIALPFAEPDTFPGTCPDPDPKANPKLNYRLLMNQYNEVISFTTVDKNVPNRGITIDDSSSKNADQLVAALAYEQMIAQLRADDFPQSDKAGDPELPIHHEPGFFLHMKEQRIEDIDIGRLASIPHGSSVTALGRSVEGLDGPPDHLPEFHAFPEQLDRDVVHQVCKAEGAYLDPYRHFTKEPFKGVVRDRKFRGFSPADPMYPLRRCLPRNVVRTTVLPLDTTIQEAGITNIPFIVRQADATSMQSWFWIMELDEPGLGDKPRMVLAYAQFIFLDFFPRRDGPCDGLIRWPHISINVMEKIELPKEEMDPGYKAARALHK